MIEVLGSCVVTFEDVKSNLKDDSLPDFAGQEASVVGKEEAKPIHACRRKTEGERHGFAVVGVYLDFVQ